MHYYFYLDESGPFEDENRSAAWPMSVVGGLMSEHPLDNAKLRPVLDKMCKFGNHGLTDRDLHAKELRVKLGDRYAEWMRHALGLIPKLGPDVRAICFRSSERLSLGDADTTYLNVMVEGLARVIPQLKARHGRSRLQLTVVLENRRVKGQGASAKKSGRADSAVERASYVSLEDYGTRIRSRLKIELIRRGVDYGFSPSADIAIHISDPATDKALNYADFVAHHARFSTHGADAELFHNLLEPLMAFDVPLVIHQGYEAAERLISEQRLGEGLFNLVQLTLETQSALVRQTAERTIDTVLARFDTIRPRLVARHLDEYLEQIEDLSLFHDSTHATDATDPTQPRGYLLALDRWCEAALTAFDQPLSSESRARRFAWRWGRFRCQQALLQLANAAGQVPAALAAISVCEPLLADFMLSVEHQPHVISFLLARARTNLYALCVEAVLPLLDRLKAFFNDTEDWWAADLPSVLPEVGNQLDRHAILCQPLGRTLHLRALARLTQRWAGRQPFDTDPVLQAAAQDFHDALDEFVFVGDRYYVCADAAKLFARLGRVSEAIAWLLRGADLAEEATLKAVRTGTSEPFKPVLASFAQRHEPTVGYTALLELLLAAKTYAAAGELEAAAAKTLTATWLHDFDAQTAAVSSVSVPHTAELWRAKAAAFATVGLRPKALDYLERAKRLLSPVAPTAPMLAGLLAGVWLDQARYVASAATRAQAVKSALTVIEPHAQLPALAPGVAALKSTSPTPDSLARIAGMFAAW